MRYRVLPYRQGSRGARALADALNGRVLRLEGSTFRQRADDLIINWGNTNPPPTLRGVLNGTGLRQASNKREFFVSMCDGGCADITPDFYTDPTDIPDDAFPIVCRTVLAGHSGEGIVIAANRAELVRAPLYVRYVKKAAEFRIHVGDRLGELTIISEQRKVRRADVENPNWQIRNHQNGFIYQRNDIVVPQAARDAAKRALAVTGLTFGAVDVIWNERQARPYVLEINTAPGLEGTTVTDYVNFFRSITGV